MLVLTRADGQRELVARCCPRAMDAGVRPGMTVAHARALVDPDSTIIDRHDEAGDARTLRRFAAWAMRFTPVVAVDPPDGLWLDVTGCERVHAGEKRLARAVTSAIHQLGFSCRVAVAPTFGAARILARHGPSARLLVEEEELVEAIAPLPVSGLRIDDDAIDGLAEVGIERIDQLLAVNRDELPARFGPEVLLAIDRLLARAFEPIDPVRPAPPPEAMREFAGPVCDVAAIERTVQDLLQSLCEGLTKRGLGVREVRITLDRSDLDPVVVDVALSRPTGDARHLWTVVRPRVDGVHMGFGVDRIVARAAATAPLRHVQRSHWADAHARAAQDARQIGEMVDVLAGRLGPDRVTMVRVVASHIPARAFRHEPMVGRKNRAAQIAEDAAIPPHPRPMRVFHHAEPARVIAVTPDGPPYRIEWRGEHHEVVRAIGPERIAGEWWRDIGAVLTANGHDYFRVCTREGRWLWMRREALGSRWAVQGEWM